MLDNYPNVSTSCKYAKYGLFMYDITIESLRDHRSKNKTVSKKMLSFCEKIIKKKMFLVKVVNARKWTQCECFL